MKQLYGRLSENNRRLYSGVEALKLSFGGINYIAELFNCSRNTVSKGIRELSEEEILPKNRERKDGGGRQAILEKVPDINEIFLSLLKEHTAGDPMEEKVKWTNLSCAQIGSLLATKGFKVSRNIVKKLLKINGYVKRKALKKKAAGGHINRNAQFERIAELRTLYEANNNPIVSVDSKKKSV